MGVTYTKEEWILINKSFEESGLKLISEFTRADYKHTFICLNPDCGLESILNFNNVKTNRSSCVHCRKNYNVYTEDDWILLNKNFDESGLKLVSKFTKSTDKHTFLCLNPKCGLESSINFSNVKNHKSRCMHCSNKSKRYTKDDWVLLNKNFDESELKLVSKFTRTQDKHTFLCLNPECGLESNLRFCSVKESKSSCVHCRSGITDRLSKKVVQFRKQKLRDRGIELLDDYITADIKYNWRCLKSDCGFIWKAKFSQIYHGKTGCPKCNRPGRPKTDGVIKSVADNPIKTRSENLRLLNLKMLNIKMLNIYVNGETSNKFKCLELNCGHEWISTLKSVAQGSGCSKCKLKSLMKSV